MKNLILILFTAAFVNCTPKHQEFPQDSIYHVDSKWETQDGNKILLSDLQGKVLVTALIYTSCNTACPRLAAEMRNISKKINVNDPDKIRYVFISVDPEHDDEAKMKEYLKQNRFNTKNWLFLRGSESDTRELANVMAVKYKQISPIEFSHSNIISVYSKSGQLVFQQEGLASDDDMAIADEISKQIKL